MEYLRTPKQTATKNGLTLFKDKDKKPIIIDFSTAEAFFNSNAAEFEKIGLNSEEVFAGFTAAAIEELENNSFVWSDFVMIDFNNQYYQYDKRPIQEVNI